MGFKRLVIHGRAKPHPKILPGHRADPTRTGGIRKKAIAELRKRYGRLSQMVREIISTSLQQRPTLNEDWSHDTNPNKVKRFREWLRQRMGSELAGDALIEAFISQAYGKGTSRAFGDVRRKRGASGGTDAGVPRRSAHKRDGGKTSGRGGTVPGDKGIPGTYVPSGGTGTTADSRSGGPYQSTIGEPFTSTPLTPFTTTQPIGPFTAGHIFPPGSLPGSAEERNYVRLRMNKAPTVQKVKLLASRTFHELEDINHRMSAAMSRTLAEGLASGWTVNRIAKQMSEQTGIAFGRAVTVTRTEIIRAHAEGQLDALEDMGEGTVGVAVEWQTADNACPRCANQEGRVYTIEEARGMIPLHPHCRCAWQPVKERKKRKKG